MAISDGTYDDFLQNTFHAITAKNLEDYLEEYPGSIPAPDPSYAEWVPEAREQFEGMLPGSGFVAAVLTTGSTGGDLGKATLTLPGMVTPVVVASVLDATQDNVYYSAAIESVSSTAAVIRVTQTSGTTLLGIPILAVPTLAAGATVYVMAYDAG